VVGTEATRETLGLQSYGNPTPLAKDHAHTLAVFSEASFPLIQAMSEGETHRLSADVGGRLSQFTTYGQQWSGKAGLNAVPARGLETDVGVSTGFKAPSLYSLYDPLYGNPRLQPEESVQVEGGVALVPSRNSRFSVRAFENRIRNRFGYDPASFRSLNVERAVIRGIEFETETKLGAGFVFRPHLTYLSSRDERTGTELTDVARWKGGLKLDWSNENGSAFGFSALSKSSRGSSAGNLRVAGFSRLDLTGRTRLHESWSATARIENAFDRDYQEIRGYTAPGLSAFAGVEYRN
jgi:vitamin B12 transporter